VGKGTHVSLLHFRERQEKRWPIGEIVGICGIRRQQRGKEPNDRKGGGGKGKSLNVTRLSIKLDRSILGKNKKRRQEKIQQRQVMAAKRMKGSRKKKGGRGMTTYVVSAYLDT